MLNREYTREEQKAADQLYREADQEIKKDAMWIGKLSNRTLQQLLDEHPAASEFALLEQSKTDAEPETEWKKREFELHTLFKTEVEKRKQANAFELVGEDEKQKFNEEIQQLQDNISKLQSGEGKEPNYTSFKTEDLQALIQSTNNLDRQYEKWKKWEVKHEDASTKQQTLELAKSLVGPIQQEIQLRHQKEEAVRKKAEADKRKAETEKKRLEALKKQESKREADLKQARLEREAAAKKLEEKLATRLEVADKFKKLQPLITQFKSYSIFKTNEKKEARRQLIDTIKKIMNNTKQEYLDEAIRDAMPAAGAPGKVASDQDKRNFFNNLTKILGDNNPETKDFMTKLQKIIPKKPTWRERVSEKISTMRGKRP